MKKFITIITGIFTILLFTGLLSASEAPLWLRYPSISPDGSKIVFSYQGDLFIVNSEGGRAMPLTRHKARDFKPVWSGDSKKIAFASDRYGNYDIFIISAEGGKAERVTMHSANDIPSDFTADNKSVIFTSSRMDSVKSTFFPSGVLSELYSVGISGKKLPVQLLTSATEDAQISKDGNTIIYHDNKGYEDQWRKHHTSSVARDIWKYSVKSGKHTKLSEFKGEDRNPVWTDGENKIYYLSEKSGTFNVWLLENSKLRQVTNFSKHPVRFLSSAANGTLCFGYNGEIYTLNSNSKPVKLKVVLPVDDSANDTEHLVMRRGATEMALSPSGKEIAFIARGEVFVTSTDYATTKRITNTPEQERSVSFSADGKKLLFAGEREGSWNIYQATIIRKDEKRFYNSTLIKVEALLKSSVETFQPLFSPDGKEIAYLEERDTIKILNLATKKTRTILDKKWNYSYSDGDQWFTWSPDSKWLLVTLNDRMRWSSEVALIKATGKEKFINITNSGYDDSRPVFANKGSMMMWFSDRNGYRSHGSWGAHYDAYGMFFTKEAFDRYKLSKEEFKLLKEKEKADKKKKKAAESKKKSKKKKDKKKKKDVKPLKIDFKNLEERVTRLTIHSSSLADAALSPDGETLVYLARFEKGHDLWSTELRTRKTRLLAKLKSWGGALEFSKDGKDVFLLSRGTIRKINVKSGKQKPVSFNAEMKLNKTKERAYMFEHMWRQVKKKFYREDLHGVDWNFYKKEYSRFLPYINNNYDFAEMASELLGELNASHTGCSYRYRMANSDRTSNFGCFMEHDKKGNLRVAEIIENSPFDTALSRVRKGTVIVSIDGIKLTPFVNYYPYMNRKAGKTVLVQLKNPATKATWYEKVKPISFWKRNSLLYKRWVKTRRLETERLSGGKIGYVHVRGMNSSSFRTAYSEILGRHNDKEAIVVDTRFNGGGWLHDDLATLLSGKKYMTFAPRGRKIGNEPLAKWFKKSIVLMSESNYSDAHMFPYTYKALGIGKLVGMPVPGTGTAVWWENLQDRSITFGIPQLGMLGNDGKYLENQQLMPDYLVKNDYESAAKGRDKQLEKAVEVLLKDVKK